MEGILGRWITAWPCEHNPEVSSIYLNRCEGLREAL